MDATTSSELGRVIETIRKRIQQIRDRREAIGEQNTKATLVDPLLAALGWDLQEIDEVRREHRRKPQDNPVDYALFLNRNECLLIEAKSLEKDLGERRWVAQNISYAAVAGVKWCVLTNGDEYRIYNSHAEVDVDEKLFRKVSITESDPKALIETIVLLSKEQMRGSLLDELWKAHFIDRRVRLALESLLNEDDGPLIRAISKRAGGVTQAETRASLKRAKITLDFPAPKVLEASTLAPVAAARRTRKAAGRMPAPTPPGATNALTELIRKAGLPLPLALEKLYKGVELEACVEVNGTVSFGGRIYDSLSTAGAEARKSVLQLPANEPAPATNGWTFWKYRDPQTGAECLIDNIRGHGKAEGLES